MTRESWASGHRSGAHVPTVSGIEDAAPRRRPNEWEGLMMNRTVIVIAALVLALTLAWYVVPLPDGDSPSAPPAATAPATQPTPAPEATPATPPAETPKQ